MVSYISLLEFCKYGKYYYGINIHALEWVYLAAYQALPNRLCSYCGVICVTTCIQCDHVCRGGGVIFEALPTKDGVGPSVYPDIITDLR